MAVESQKLYFVISLSESNKNVIIQQISFSSFDLTSATVTTKKTIETTSINRIVNGFIFGEKIVVLYFGNDSKLYIYINKLDFSDIDLNVWVSDSAKWEGYGLFFKGIQIKNELMGFSLF